MKIDITPLAFAEIEQQLREAGQLDNTECIDEEGLHCIKLSSNLTIRKAPNRLLRLGKPVTLTLQGRDHFHAFCDGKAPPIRVTALQVGLVESSADGAKVSLGWSDEDLATVIDLGSFRFRPGDVATVGSLSQTLIFRIS